MKDEALHLALEALNTAYLAVEDDMLADEIHQAITAIKKALAAQPAVPEGWRLVPETPTNDMTSAMADALEDPENERSSWDLAENMYRAGITAAPEKGQP
jgi:hypothetical protein